MYTHICVYLNVLEYRVHQATIVAVDADGDEIFINN